MHLPTFLSIHYPPAAGMRGAMTTPADLARYKRAGFITDLSQHVHLVCTAGMESKNARGAGNRWRRRWRALLDAKYPLRLARSFDPTPADTAADTATEGYARRPFRTNPHD